MRTQLVDYGATNAFSSLCIDYIARSPRLAPFYGRFPDLPAFADQIRDKAASYSPEQRAVLVSELQRQYGDLGDDVHPEVAENIARLSRSNCFALVTGHQLNLMTGPLFWAYKIISTVKLAFQLGEAHPDCCFVPVFYMATEDHDLAEIDHFSFAGKTFRWKPEQRGATGRMRIDDSLVELLDSLPARFRGITATYGLGSSLAQATRRLAHELFGRFGVVALDADSPALKAFFRPVVESEIDGTAIHRAITAADARLEKLGYRPQIHARPTNLFYLYGDLRTRLERRFDGNFEVVGTGLVFSRDELRTLSRTHPERFSPNVGLRPLYQEILLPNVAYVGGGSELAYWGQLKGVFDLFSVPFPIVVLRNSAMYMDRSAVQLARELELEPADFFADTAALKRRLAERLGDVPVDVSEELAQIAAAFARLEARANGIDAAAARAAVAHGERAARSVRKLRARMEKARDRRHERTFAKLDMLKAAMLPGGVLQERVEGLLTILAGNRNLLDDLYAAFDPLAFKFTILMESS
ncbi:Bacillithiol biosynthesis BshC [Hyaloraphidium curvatum]|nr:Bacillithiol biosynthesis BshC [Hyaloraphidium curvatum]